MYKFICSPVECLNERESSLFYISSNVLIERRSVFKLLNTKQLRLNPFKD